MKNCTIVILLSFTFVVSCKNENQMSQSLIDVKIPVAKKISKALKIHDDTRIDNYYWLNNKENPEVLDYLNAENAYTKVIMRHTESFQKSLFEEMKGRIKEDDSSVPYKFNGYWYLYSQKRKFRCKRRNFV